MQKLLEKVSEEQPKSLKVAA